MFKKIKEKRILREFRYDLGLCRDIELTATKYNTWEELNYNIKKLDESIMVLNDIYYDKGKIQELSNSDRTILRMQETSMRTTLKELRDTRDEINRIAKIDPKKNALMQVCKKASKNFNALTGLVGGLVGSSYKFEKEV